MLQCACIYTVGVHFSQVNWFYLLVFSSPCLPALWGEGSENSSGGHRASPGGMSHSPAEDEYSEVHYDWQALVGIADKIIVCVESVHTHFVCLVDMNLLKSPLHIHSIGLWQVAPGRLKSQDAQVASSTMADG